MTSKDYSSVFVNSREPEKLMKTLDMTYTPKGYRNSTESQLNQNARTSFQSSDLTMTDGLSKYDQQVLVRGSRKGTQLNDPLAFNKRPQEARNNIDNLPILPKLGCSDQSFVARVQDQKYGGMFRSRNNRHLTDTLVYNTHPESSDPFLKKTAKSSARRHSADRNGNKPIYEDEVVTSPEARELPFAEPYKYTVFNIETQSSKINFRHDRKAGKKNKGSLDSTRVDWDSVADFSTTSSTNSREEKPVNKAEKPKSTENDDVSLAFKDFVDPCLHPAHTSADSMQYSPLLAVMYDTGSNNSAISGTGSDGDELPIVNNTDPRIYNVADMENPQFPEPPSGPGQVEDGTMTSFINWNPRPMYLAAPPMYVQPVFYPIDDKRFGPQYYPPANMIEASLKELSTTSRPVTPIYYTPQNSEVMPVPMGDTNSKNTPIYYVQDKATGLEEAKNSSPETEELDTEGPKKPKKEGFFRRMASCFQSKKKPVAEEPSIIVTPKGSLDRSELRRVRNTSSQTISQKPTKKPQRKRSGCMRKNEDDADGYQELVPKSSSPSIVVINVPNDRNIILAKQGSKKPRKKRSAMKLRRPPNNVNKLTSIRRSNRVPADAKDSEIELSASQQQPTVYVMNEPARSGFSPVASSQELRRKSPNRMRKQKSSGKMCAGKRRSDDATQTAGDPPYGSHDQYGHNHMKIN